MLLSIIVPVYNVEEYLPQCIESIASINIKDIEIILVNDGSTDNSKSICSKYKKTFNNIKLIDRLNGGLSAARNTGILNSSGKYIMFVDSDDYVNTDNLYKVIEFLRCNDLDVIMGDYYEVIEDETKIIHNCNSKIIRSVDKKILKEIFNEFNGLWPAWKNIVKKEFLIKNNIIFKEEFLHEDIDFTTRILLNMENYAYIDVPWYYYRTQRVGSIMNKRNFKSLNDILEIVIELNEYIDELNLDCDLNNVIKNRLRKNIYMSINLVKKANKDELNNLINILNHNKNILCKTDNYKHNIFYYFYKIFGIKKSVYLCNLIKG